jgi:hypothetical protein
MRRTVDARPAAARESLQGHPDSSEIKRKFDQIPVSIRFRKRRAAIRICGFSGFGDALLQDSRRLQVPGAPLRSCLVIPLGPTGSSSNGRVRTVFLRNGTAKLQFAAGTRRKGIGFGVGRNWRGHVECSDTPLTIVRKRREVRSQRPRGQHGGQGHGPAEAARRASTSRQQCATVRAGRYGDGLPAANNPSQPCKHRRNSGTPASSTARSTAGFAPAFPRGTEVCYSVREKEKSLMRPISLLLALAAIMATAHAEGMMNDVSVNFCHGKVMPPCYKWNGPRLELPPRAISAYASQKGWSSSVYPIPFVAPSEAALGLRALCRAGSLLTAHSISGSVRVTRLLLDPPRTLPDRQHLMCSQLPQMFLRIFRARSQEPLHGLAAVAGPAPKQASRAGTLSFDMDRYLETTRR